MTDQATKDVQDLIPEFWEGDLHITMSLQLWNFGALNISDNNWAKNDSHYVLIHTAEGMRLDIPHKIDVRAAAVKGLEKEKQDILAQAHTDADRVQKRIDSLLQLTHEATS